MIPIIFTPFIHPSFKSHYKMPPKQKEAKKGPVYKAALPPKDIVPADIK
jgi:hypothetical protein